MTPIERKKAMFNALKKAGAIGMTCKELGDFCDASKDEVHRLISSKIETGKLAYGFPKSTHPQVYVLPEHLAEFKEKHAQKRRDALLEERRKARKQPEPVKSTPKPAPLCNGTTGLATSLPRMVSTRQGAEDHLSIQSRRGDKFVTHRPTIHLV